MAPLVSPDELRTYLKVPAAVLSNERALIALEGVSDLIRSNPRIAHTWEVVEDEVAVLDGSGSRTLLLPKLPVRDVLEVVEAPDAAAELVLASTSIEWSVDGRIRRLDGGVFADRLRYYRVTYKHGEAVPAGVKLVVMRVCARAATNPEGLTSENAPGYGAQFGFDATRLATLAEPDLVDLEPYMVTV